MLHTLQCVSCQERFLFDESLTTQPITAGGHMCMKGPGRSVGEQGLYCPRCQVDNRKWLEIEYPRVYAEVQVARRKNPDTGSGGNTHTIFGVGLVSPGTLRLLPRDMLPGPFAHKGIYAILMIALVITLLFWGIAWMATEGWKQALLIILIGTTTGALLYQTLTGWQNLREWEQLGKAGLRRRSLTPSPLLRSGLLLITVLAVIMPLLIHVGLPMLVRAVGSFETRPAPTPAERAAAADAALGRFYDTLDPAEQQTWSQITETMREMLKGRAAGAEVKSAPVLPAPDYEELSMWMMILLSLGAAILSVAYLGVKSYVQAMERELPRPLFRDLGRLTPVALRDAQHALDLDDIHLHQVRWLGAVRNAQGGLSLHGIQHRDQVQVASYRVETDMYGRPVSIRVQDQFSTS